MISSAGSAAEKLIYGNHDEQAAGTDRKDFDAANAPSPETTTSEVSLTLAGKRRQLKRLISMLKSKARAVDFDLTRLPERTMDGSNKRYLMLLSKEEIESAVQRSKPYEAQLFSGTNRTWVALQTDVSIQHS